MLAGDKLAIYGFEVLIVSFKRFLPHEVIKVPHSDKRFIYNLLSLLASNLEYGNLLDTPTTRPPSSTRRF